MLVIVKIIIIETDYLPVYGQQSLYHLRKKCISNNKSCIIAFPAQTVATVQTVLKEESGAQQIRMLDLLTFAPWQRGHLRFLVRYAGLGLSSLKHFSLRMQTHIHGCTQRPEAEEVRGLFALAGVLESFSQTKPVSQFSFSLKCIYFLKSRNYVQPT